ncbi:unnamed protein product [Phyllotreta striolata]|uniref:Leprecan-like alpha-helical domain-containing protein n=1 Tax=Phyllotreta striolata TaxID=444603 RepID=A0A9P0DP10_PHYSR|nr:unnamed protein product [Phyllotreta striolata]
MSATTCIISLLLLNCLYAHVRTNDANVTETSVQLYEKGVEAYLENRWEDCVDLFEKALSKYGKYRKKVQRCRLLCKNEAELSEPLYPVNIDNLLFFERAIRQTLCIIDCENDDPEILDNYINLETGNLFEEQRPYEYLHICYFQTKDIVKAASSAFTYLVAHPDNKIMANNLQHYLDQNVDKKDIVNYEAKDYVYLYVHGSEAYEYKDWDSVISNMEESLTEYLQAEDECRAQCEGPFDHGWYPDFIPSISNHFTVCLKCKQKCRKKLSSLNGEIHDDLLPSHYHYLQYAYYKIGNLKAACAAVASYLTFYPDDDTMLDNMKYYSKLPKVQNDYFRPREEAIRYVQRQIYESRLLKFVHNEFAVQGAGTAKTEELKRRLHVIMSEKVLKGSKRMVLDGLATSKECKTLMEIAKYFAILGDGYDGRKSPHTIMEKFEGITLSRTLFLTYFKMLRPKYLDVFLRITDTARKYIKNYFKIKKNLYFSFTHLVCRTALPGMLLTL